MDIHNKFDIDILYSSEKQIVEIYPLRKVSQLIRILSARNQSEFLVGFGLKNVNLF